MQLSLAISLLVIAIWLLVGKKKKIGCAGCNMPNCSGRITDD